MKHLTAILTILILTFPNQAHAQAPTLTIEHLMEDSLLNVRALEVQDGKVVVATSDSRVLIKEKDKQNFMLAWPIDTTNKPNFRSLAINGDDIFAMSIASPALLYKNGKVVYRENHEKAFYDAMSFWNQQEGIAMGDPTDECISIIITRDGGETWDKIPCENLPKAKEGEAAFAASDTNIKTLGDHVWIATGGINSRIMYSPDKGENWEVIDIPVIQGKPTTGLYSVDFYDEQNGFAIGGDYTDPEMKVANKIKTIDGGKTWKIVAKGQNPDYRSCVQYVPDSQAQKLVAIGFQGIDYSYDGGETWEHLSDESYYTIRFIDEKTAIAAGNRRISKITF